MRGQRLIWLFVIIFVLSSLFMAYCGWVNEGDVSGWIQVAIELIAIPVLWNELAKIREELNNVPSLSIGLATINDLPSSKVRLKNSHETEIKISQGYPHFFLVVKNNKAFSVKSIKIHLVHLREEDNLLEPFYRGSITPSEFSSDKPSFYSENNFEFYFSGSTQFTLYAQDTEIFGFHFRTSIIKNAEKNIPYPPSMGTYKFDCYLWADGLDEPLKTRLEIIIE